MSERALLAALERVHLVALGAFAPGDMPGVASLVLVGPKGGRDWWTLMTAAPEWADGQADPLDRWSRKVLGGIAQHFGGRAVLPSDGPPFAPFYTWALQSGRVFESPVRLLVHADAGLWVSFRGALALPFAVVLPPQPNPCATCADQPCRTACPVGALTPAGYDTGVCHGYLDTASGADCLTGGCRARGACPLSVRHARLAEQSAYHMGQFHR